MRPHFLPGLSDWPFAVKMGLPPALALGGLLFLGVFGTLEHDSQTLLLHRIADGDLAQAAALIQAQTDIAAAQSRIDRLFAATAETGRQNAPPAMAVPQAGAEPELAAWQVRAEAMRRRLDDTIRAGALPAGELPNELAQYGAALGALHEAGIGGPQAGRAVDEAAGRLLRDLTARSAALVADAADLSRSSERSAREFRAVFIATALCVFWMVAGCVATITRRTVLAVQRIARATLLVASGDQSQQIHQLARRDELGAIVESLRAFQSNNARISFLAHHDALTALPNRALFHERLKQALQHCPDGMRCAVHCLDLDQFKSVNDTLGHSVGDALLQCVAARLVRCVRDSDTVARLGGDEFAIIQLDVDGAPDAGALAHRIIDTLSQPYEIERHQIMIGTSIGIAIGAPGNADPDLLPCNADLALFRAKAEGRSTWRIYESNMDAALHQRRLMELDMRAALAGEQFELYYLPLVNVLTREVNGLEALIRWHHPQQGMIAPADFIPLAEETGMIVQIGAWVLRQACTDAATWPSHLKVSVNLSPMQFRDTNLVPIVQQALTEGGLPAWRLEVEITEAVLLAGSDAVLATLNRLRAMGIGVAMDDFGTGSASVSTLRSFRFDKIKIDRSFIRDLADGTQSAAIVHAVTGLGHSLGIPTTASGVETEEQLARLRAEGCTEVQGYLFSPPCPARDVARVVAEITKSPASGLVAVGVGVGVEMVT